MPIFDVICGQNESGETIPIHLVVERDIVSVRDISDHWHESAGDFFRVKASDGETYLICQAIDDGDWRLVSVEPN